MTAQGGALPTGDTPRPTTPLPTGDVPPPTAPPAPTRPTPAGGIRLVFDGGFIGPMLPPPAPVPPSQRVGWIPAHPGWFAAPPPTPPPPTEATLAIPLNVRGLVKESLDMLTRSDSGLRGASFYIGFMMLITFGPLVALFALVFVAQADAILGSMPGYGAATGPDPADLAWAGWLAVAAIPGMLGYIAATVEARTLATAVIGARAEGRPLRLVESISLARKGFWSVLGVQVLVGIVSSFATVLVSLGVLFVIGPVEPISYGLQLVVGLLIGTPVVYVPAAIVLGGTDLTESIRRSFRLARARKGLAVVVTLFGLISQFVVLFGLSAGLDAVARFIDGTGLTESFPPALVVPVAAAFVFAIGTLVFLVEAIAAAPPVYAFIALTHYTWGLEAGRQDPVRVRHAWDPWLTPGLALVAVLALLALLGGVMSLSG